MGKMRRYLSAGLLAALVCSGLAAGQAVGKRTPQQALRARLSSLLRSAGGNQGAYVIDLHTGRTLFSAAPSVRRLPASVEKVYTTSTALLRFGPNANLLTKVLGVGSTDSNGVFSGTLYLRGGGDPSFGDAAFDNYAYGTGATVQRLVTDLRRTTGITRLRGRVVGDESYFDSRRGTPATAYGASAYVEGLLSGLAFDRGFTNPQGSALQSHPALFAARHFLGALRSGGVKAASGTRVSTGRTPDGARLLAALHSPRIATLARLTNSPSDNFFAEMLIKDLGARFGGSGTTAAGAGVIRAEVASAFGIHPRLVDGSGLSRQDHTSPREVVSALRHLVSNRSFFDSLAIAGIRGTMRYEMVGTRAVGRCRGKTGTLHDVANLAGYCTARDGHTLAYAFMLSGVDPVSGHSYEDRMGVALANYDG